MNIQSLFAVLSISLALGLSAMTSSTMAAPPPKPHQATVLEEYKKPPSFLFVLQANEATIEPVKGKANTYTMSMKLTEDNVGKIIAFTDRPYRIVEYMTVKQLQQLWGEGTNSFKVDPPNAVLSAQGLDASIVIIQSVEITEGELLLTLVGLSNKQLNTVTTSTPVLVIDGCASHPFGNWCMTHSQAIE